MNPARYRIRLFLDICRTIFLPVLVLSLILNVTQKRLGLLTVPCHVLFIVLWASSQGAILKYAQDREARRLGTKPIPRIVGKLPGNIDILLKMLWAFKTSYVLDVYLNLFEEYQCTTLNTRILWLDNVSSVTPRTLHLAMVSINIRSYRWIKSTPNLCWLLVFVIFGEEERRRKECLFACAYSFGTATHFTLGRPFLGKVYSTGMTRWVLSPTRYLLCIIQFIVSNVVDLENGLLISFASIYVIDD